MANYIPDDIDDMEALSPLTDVGEDAAGDEARADKRKRGTAKGALRKRARTDSSGSSLEELPPTPQSPGLEDSTDSEGEQVIHPPLAPLVQTFRLPEDEKHIDDAFSPADYDEFADMLDILTQNWGHIRTYSIGGKRVDIHNVRLIGQSPDAPSLEATLESLYDAYQTSFDINLLQSFVLENVDTGEQRYFYFGDNTRVFDSALVIRNRANFDSFLKILRTKDVANKAVHRRPNSKWVLRALTNIAIIITRRQTSYATGRVRLPKWLARNRGVLNFKIDDQRNRIRDRLCAFRCLAYDLFPNAGSQRLTTAARLFMGYYCREVLNIQPEEFRGILLQDIPKLEWYFDRSITVLQLKPYINEWPEKKKKRKRRKQPRQGRQPRPPRCGGLLDDEAFCEDDDSEEEEQGQEDAQLDPVQIEEARLKRLEKEAEAIKKRRFSAVLLHRGTVSAEARERIGAGGKLSGAAGREKQKLVQNRTPLFINLFQGENGSAHYSLIKNLDLYTKQYHCPKCSRLFHHLGDLHKHEANCKSGRTEDLYPGNGFRPRQTVLEILASKYNIEAPEECRFHPYYATHDWECLTPAIPGTKRLTPIPDIDFELPAEMDAKSPPEGLPDAIRKQWIDVHTHYGVRWEYAIIYQPKINDVQKIVTKLAAKQTQWFGMTVQALIYRPARQSIDRTTIASAEEITNPQEFETFLTTITNEKIREYSHQGQRIALEVKIAVHRLQYTAQCIPASVSVATNIPWPRFQQPDGTPKAFFLLAKGTEPEDTNELVCRFLQLLYMIAEVARVAMHERLQPVFAQLEHLWLNVNLFRMHQLIREVLNRTVEKKLAQANELYPGIADEGVRDMYNEIMIEVEDLQETEEQLQSDMMLVGQNTARLELPQKWFKQYGAYFNYSEKREYYECGRRCRDLQYLHKQLQEYCQTLTTFGFNSGKFDLNLIKSYLLPELQRRQEEVVWKAPDGTADWYVNAVERNRPLHIIKRLQNYMSITSNRIHFRDMSNFLAAGTSYEGFLKSQEVSSNKFFWPHDYFTSLDVLEEEVVPPIEAFYNSLRDEHMRPEDYQLVCDTWREKKFRHLGDMLKYYNNQDVLPFLEGIEKVRQFYMAPGNGAIDFIGGGNISLPGISEQMAYRMVDPHVNFVLPQRTTHTDNSDLHHICKQNTVGGPSIIFRRYVCKDKTRIRTGDNNSEDHLLCRTIWSLDVNSLYLKASSLPQPTQIPRHWRIQADGTFVGRPFYRCAQSQLEWLEWESYCRGIKIWHRFNGGIEQFGGLHAPKVKGERTPPDRVLTRDIKVEGYSVDGWDPKTNTVYLFDGCYWHNHEGCSRTTDRLSKATEEEKAKILKNQRKDAAIRDDLQRKGYKVISIWECEWIKFKRPRYDPYPEGVSADFLPNADPTVKVYMQKRGYDLATEMLDAHNAGATRLNQFRDKYFILPRYKRGLRLTQDELIEAVKDGKFFGIVMCDIHVPDQLREEFAELQPIFKNYEVSRDDIGEHMKAHCEKHNEWRDPKRMLVGSYVGEAIAVISPLLQWYIQKGFKITRIYIAFEWKPFPCFQPFAKMVTEGRRASDRDPALAPIGNLKKHLQVVILDGKQLEAKETDPYRKSVEELFGDSFEVELRKRKISWTTNFPFGFFVYGYAKLHMLRFHYDFLRRYHDPRMWELILMDTDSEFLALAGNSLDDCIRAEFRGTSEYEEARIEFLGHRDGPDAEFDKREPGKLKKDWQGIEITALNSKTYFGIGTGSEGDKSASKGLQKRLNPLKMEHYKHVLKTRQSHFGRCRSFKASEAGIYRFDGERAGLTYIYGKRPVAEDGIMTTAFLK